MEKYLATVCHFCEVCAENLIMPKISGLIRF